MTTTNRHPSLRRKVNIQSKESVSHRGFNAWKVVSIIATFWVPSLVLKLVFGFKDPETIQAWREKVTLCLIILLMSGVLVFTILFFPDLVCPTKKVRPELYDANKNFKGFYGILGKLYTLDKSRFDITLLPKYNPNLMVSDLTPFIKTKEFKECTNFGLNLNDTNCINGKCIFEYEEIIAKGFVESKKTLIHSWKKLPPNFYVIKGVVVNLTPIIKIKESKNKYIQFIVKVIKKLKTKDATKVFDRNKVLAATIPCLMKRYRAGVVEKMTPGCFIFNSFQLISVVIVAGIILIRLCMATVFHWFLASKYLKRQNKNSNNPPTTTTIKHPTILNKSVTRELSNNHDELYTVILVTCYSENEESMKNTLDSLANTDYSDNKKLLFIIADGIITGSGNIKSTPDIIKGMIEIDPSFENPEPKSYIAVADGSKQHNMAIVYCGYYKTKDHKVPTVCVIKCGTPQERDYPKAGNRGKRDSQLILMSFFNKVIFDDKMTPLDYDLFVKIHYIIGITPDCFETVLMVDADTIVYPSALKMLTNCLLNDEMVMGLCGETKIANKKSSLTTMIQVFEYYISHHIGKGFEAVFGGVTCLPGCFCMYRLKTKKGNKDWIPLLTKPQVVNEYSKNLIKSLHEKNLFLLGEDRFLSTLMLKNFPNRKLTFVPAAICKTIVPDDFKVLLSQRRRWINSTIHNLLELVLVRELCGTFCFSMQFVIFMELIGTCISPVSILMMYYLIIVIVTTTNVSHMIIPAILLALSMLSPAIFILLTTRKMVYVLWMIIYLLFLFIWQLVLPVYSFWHFDDFSWGATRTIEENKKENKQKPLINHKVPLRKWDVYERDRFKELGYSPKKNYIDHRSYISKIINTENSKHSSFVDFSNTSRASIHLNTNC